ncbi:DUF2931 family protein [Pedobacter sp. Hv1]|uniref:DUF2931 family protein n=1 Tax=Pedobacter sp. Hv1 TaxID=1740090 RepID=UPI0006D8A74E|nr:DUF2931 family protein [Pedobacter sp. Hv1]KQC00130.1 hypothetical protein AQF98_13890 [Pedobacter sp. Hv1]
MKLNFINKAYIALALVLGIAISIKIITYKSWERYYYFSSVTAPPSYPIAIRNSYFILPFDDDATINTENVRAFNTTWGDEYNFAETHQALRLPEKLVIEYVSYRDKKFYKDTLSLPTAQIKQLFIAATKQNQLEELYSPRGDQKGLRFLIGIANNGNILVWLRGAKLEKLILKTKLQAYEPSRDDTYYEKPLPKELYFKKVFEQLPDSIKLKIAKGWDKHANYADSTTNYLKAK